MRRWNGWGNDQFNLELPDGGRQFLQERIGTAPPLSDTSLETACEQVPASRLPEHADVITNPEDRVRHARGQSLADWLAMRSGNFGVFPDGVAYPESSQDVQALLRYAEEHGISVIPYGGGTSVAGHINPVDGDKPVLTVDMGRMNRLIDLDRESQIATFGAGTPGPLVESQLRALGYTLGHFPQSFELSTIPASSAGPDIREMILGSEGRIGLITEVKVRVTPLPAHESFHVVFFPSWDEARTACRKLVQNRTQLSMLRLSNATETETQLALAGHPALIGMLESYLSMRGSKDGKCMMTFGITGSKRQCHNALICEKPSGSSVTPSTPWRPPPTGITWTTS